MPKYIILLSLYICTCLGKIQAQPKDFSTKVAIVDVQAILENSDAVNYLRQELDQISHKIQTEMSKREAQLKKEEEDLVKQKAELSEEAFQKEVDKFNTNVSKAQKIWLSQKEELERIHAEAMQEVHGATIEVISKLSQKYGFNLTLPSAQVLFVKENLNITAEVIKELNLSLKKVSINFNLK